jgi:tetratricopeptide (TPR) repeat protein
MSGRKWMLAGLLVFPLLGNCGKKEEIAASSTAAEVFDTPWSCEEHWMVASVVRDLQGMTGLAGEKPAQADVTPGKVDREYLVGATRLVMAPSCWDPESYLPLLETWKPVAQGSTEAVPDLLHNLLTPTATVIQEANDAVSKHLGETPTDPLAHEHAAFLLGVFGIRENARQFSDLRPLLCRMTAHLTLARKLRAGNKPSPVGQWAQVLYDYHAGRPLKSLEVMQLIPTGGDAGRWKRVVELLITGDWRRTGDLAEPSLAEAIAHSRALKLHRGNPMMLEFVTGRKDLQAVPEWSRLLSGTGKSVEEGHIAMKSAVAMELLEIAAIFQTGKEPKPDKLAKFLALESPVALIGKDGTPRVIPDGEWAAYFRRHFFAACADVSRFAIRQWDSPEAAAEWEKSTLAYCRKLPGHELVEPLLATKPADYQSDLRATAEFVRRNPEKVPTGLWYDYRFPSLRIENETSMPGQTPWFREVSPPGTAHDPARRIRFEGIQGGDWVNNIRALHELDPWNPELCYELAENSGNNLASVRSAWGALREYSVRPLRQILEGPTLTADERIETLQIFTTLDPKEGLRLGSALAIAGRPEEAIKAYETAFRDAPDRVAVANRSLWMIHYYKSRGEDAKAREVADHNAEVYSLAGLFSALVLAIEEKDATRAMGYAKAISERYGNNSYLVAAAWGAGRDEKALRSVFPEGLREVTAADFDPALPLKGVRLKENSVTANAVGLKAGDVVLAVDGKRVETFDQYLLLMSSKLDPHTRIIYRRGKRIGELDCQIPDLRLDVDMGSVAK